MVESIIVELVEEGACVYFSIPLARLPKIGYFFAGLSNLNLLHETE